MDQPSEDSKTRLPLEEDICIHIFTVSAAMVGVCLTVIGIIRLLITIRKADTIADDLLAADAVLFLLATLISYWALRRRSLRRRPILERTADCLFLLAMLLMVAVSGYITYALSTV